MTEPDLTTPADREAFRAANQSFVDKWKVAGPIKAAVRVERIRAADTVRAIADLAGMRLHALRAAPPPDRSGLVTMQRWLQQIPKDDRVPDAG